MNREIEERGPRPADIFTGGQDLSIRIADDRRYEWLQSFATVWRTFLAGPLRLESQWPLVSGLNDEAFAMASSAMSKIFATRQEKAITNVGEFHVPPTAFHYGASQSGGDKINSPGDNARDQGAL